MAGSPRPWPNELARSRIASGPVAPMTIPSATAARPQRVIEVCGESPRNFMPASLVIAGVASTRPVLRSGESRPACPGPSSRRSASSEPRMTTALANASASARMSSEDRGLDDVGHRGTTAPRVDQMVALASAGPPSDGRSCPDVATPNRSAPDGSRPVSSSVARAVRGIERMCDLDLPALHRHGARSRHRRRHRPRRRCVASAWPRPRSASQPLPTPSRSNRRPAGRATCPPRGPCWSCQPRLPAPPGRVVPRRPDSASSRATSSVTSTIPSVRSAARRGPFEQCREGRTHRDARGRISIEVGQVGPVS